jgi:putative DNA primase/helicase
VSATTTYTKPAVVRVNPEQIPDELKARKQWVAWDFEWDAKREDWTKVPRNVQTGCRASSTKPTSWSTFADALAYADAHGLPGIGYVFCAGDPFCGVDLDDCRDPVTGALEPWAENIVRALDSFAESSPSGTGIHAIIRATCSGDRNRKGSIEIYDRDRYFTVTGHQLERCPATINHRQEALDTLYCTLFPPTEQASNNGHHAPSELADSEILRLALSESTDKFARLYFDGDTSDHYGDDSAADLALCCKLAFYTRDASQIERLVGASALGQRPKWQERANYRNPTITKALDLVTETYTPSNGRRTVTASTTNRHADNNDDSSVSDDSYGSGKASQEEKPDRRSAADRLIGYARDALTDTDYFVDQYGQGHILVDSVPLPLPRGAYPWLRMLMWKMEEKGTTGEALQVAAGTLEAMALYAGRTIELHVRAAWNDDALFVELAPGHVCRIDAQGFEIELQPPVLFRRYINLSPLPDPTSGGQLDDFVDLIIPKREQEGETMKAVRRLLTAHTVLALLPHVARPMLLFTGPQGSGKTTRQRHFKRLLDPTKPESLRLDQRDFVQKVAHAQIVLFDNLTVLPDWAIDSFCRLVTGEADSKRVLYSDDQDFIYELRRLVLLNGINVPADRPDFADRLLPIDLPRIEDMDRVEEDALSAKFFANHAAWLGAIFSLLSKTIAKRQLVRPPRLPRLADWGRWAAAVYAAMGEEDGQFWLDWQQVVKRQHAAAIEGSPLAQVVIAFMKDRSEWKGAPGRLYEALCPLAEQLGFAKAKEWPKDVRWLGRRLREVGPVLAAQGITFTDDDRTSSSRTITILNEPKNDVTDDMSNETAKRAAFSDDGSDNTPSDDVMEKIAEPPRISADDNTDDIPGDTSAPPTSCQQPYVCSKLGTCPGMWCAKGFSA